MVVDEINAVWAIDFMRDGLYGGRIFRTFNFIDDPDRGGLGIEAAVSIPARRVVGNNLVKRTVSFPAFTTSRIRFNINNALYVSSRVVEIEAWKVAP